MARSNAALVRRASGRPPRWQTATRPLRLAQAPRHTHATRHFLSPLRTSLVLAALRPSPPAARRPARLLSPYPAPTHATRDRLRVHSALQHVRLDDLLSLLLLFPSQIPDLLGAEYCHKGEGFRKYPNLLVSRWPFEIYLVFPPQCEENDIKVLLVHARQLTKSGIVHHEKE